MRQNYRKILYCLTIIGTLLSGCGGEAPTSESSPTPTATEPPTTDFPAAESPTATENNLDKAVAAAIFEYNQNRYGDDYEVFGEGHIVMDLITAEDTVTVYAKTMYGGYQFQDGNFVKNGGTGDIPAVITFSKEADGTYAVLQCQYPSDGSDYLKSIHELFPKALWERCVSNPPQDRDELKEQEQAYARAYLETIGRTAVIGDYGDFEHTIYSDVGISAEVSNNMDDYRKYDQTWAYAPFWLGHIERLEDGVRYIYDHSYEAETHEIIYRKIIYGTGEVIASATYDSTTGEKTDG